MSFLKKEEDICMRSQMFRFVSIDVGQKVKKWSQKVKNEDKLT